MEDVGVEVKTDFIRGAQGLQGDKGDRGEKGDTGAQGEKGEAFTFEDLTSEQIEQLRNDLYEGLVTEEELDIARQGMAPPNKVIKDFGKVRFQAVANQKVKIKIPITNITNVHKLIIRVMSHYNEANYAGMLEKTNSFIATTTQAIISKSEEYTYIGNKVALAFAIGEMSYSEGNVEIPISSLSNKLTDAKIMIEGYYFNEYTKTALESATLSEIYTTDTTVYEKPRKQCIQKDIEYYANNLNNLKETGFYYASGDATNIPQAGYSHYITVIAYTQNYIIQKASRVTSNIKNFEEYERQCYNGTWTSWKLMSQANITTGTEFKTGRIIDGKEEYGKKIDFGALPNATTKAIAHGVIGIKLHEIVCEFEDSTTQITFSNYGVNPKNLKPLTAYVGSTNINIHCEGDSSGYTGYVTLYYTKNS